jgi:hypothetical protein
METKLETTVVVHLSMSKKEAEWLKQLMYNIPASAMLGDKDTNSDMTQAFYAALKNID